jgi:hypothetical protein
MGLEFFTPQDLSPTLTQEIVCFLDSQTTSHPFQFPQWSGAGSYFAVLRQANQIRWFANCGTQFPLGTRLTGLRALTVNRGPVCDDPELWRAALDEFAEQMRQKQFIYLDAAPDRLELAASDRTCGFGPGWNPLGENRVSLRLNVTKSEDELLARLRKATRYDVRRAERAELIAEPSKQPSDAKEFLRLYKSLAERKGFSPDPEDHVLAIIRWLETEPARGALLLARDRAAVVGGAVIVRSGKRCWYVWGASDKNDRFSAGQLLQWRAILWAKAHGCTEYDFGGYTPHATSGPAWFKEGFGGEIVRFAPPHRNVFRPRWHGLVQALARMRR